MFISFQRLFRTFIISMVNHLAHLGPSLNRCEVLPFHLFDLFATDMAHNKRNSNMAGLSWPTRSSLPSDSDVEDMTIPAFATTQETDPPLGEQASSASYASPPTVAPPVLKINRIRQKTAQPLVLIPIQNMAMIGQSIRLPSSCGTPIVAPTGSCSFRKHELMEIYSEL